MGRCAFAAIFLSLGWIITKGPEMEKITLDTQGLLCPLPVLKAKKALRFLKSGDLLEVTTTDPGAIADFKCLCEEDGLELLSQTEEGEVTIHLLKKA